MRETGEIRAPKMAWQAPSLRGRVTLLAASVVAMLLLTLWILISIVRSTQANVVGGAEKHLQAVANSMKDAYETRPVGSVSLAAVETGPPPPRIEGPPPPVPPPPPPPAPTPPRPGVGEQALETLTAGVLHDETGIEGGFFRESDQRLVGYAFPTHEGPGDPKALPARETPDILNVSTTAVLQRHAQLNRFYGTHDVVLFAAVPVCESKACENGPIGAAWLMQRLPGAERDRKRALLWAAFGFGAAACITVLLAFLVLRQVGLGTEAVLDRLTWMESDLSTPERRKTTHLAEFHRVLDGLDRLGETLRGQIERERELQNRVRQNERLAAIGQLAAGVAHELRNPLATIRLRAQMAQRKTQEEATSQASTVILAEVARLDGIIERLLDFARPIRVNCTSAEISQLAESAVERWAARFPGIAIRYSGAPGVKGTVDPMRLDQVFDNLLENATHQLLETRRPDPRIEIDCRSQDAGVQLCVSDNGGGFTAEALKNAIEPFFTTRAKGTGLGLSITREIVHAFGGTIALSNQGEGAVVCIQIPERKVS